MSFDLFLYIQYLIEKRGKKDLPLQQNKPISREYFSQQKFKFVVNESTSYPRNVQIRFCDLINTVFAFYKVETKKIYIYNCYYICASMQKCIGKEQRTRNFAFSDRFISLAPEALLGPIKLSCKSAYFFFFADDDLNLKNFIFMIYIMN